ncbi:nitrate- and nitrite sensing domain-containing protein [Streptomyces sp. GC420]|uniref:sensor histidine kinase n=1 Tax=Streptomyces sp. GC420 TaxID=2697568 RepID=UPI001FB57026|nr:nitrate- and nitrite sensing domain-containing protein [Streptomyces sp. GC420]
MKRSRGNRPAEKTAATTAQTVPAPGTEGTAGTAAAPTPPKTAVPAGTGRSRKVRSRLVIAVAVVGAAVLGAGAPAVWAASEDVTESQRLVDLAEQSRQAITLAHSLADERDDVTAFIAAGRDSEKGPGVSESRSARVDRQIREIRAGAPADLRAELDEIAGVRRQALTGKGSALDAHKAYTAAVAELHSLVDELDRRLPPRAGDSRGLPDLSAAVEQAAAARGLLLAALAVPPAADGGSTTVVGVDGLPVTVPTEPTAADRANDKLRDELSAAAQQARVREQAELAEYEEHAPKTGADKLRATVTGPEVEAAEGYLARLTDQPTLSDEEQALKADRVESALSARVDLLRGVESSLATAEAERLAQLRDDDVTALEVHIGLAGVCLLIAVGYGMATARTLTRPLAVLRLGAKRLAADPVAEEPVRFTGRNDEFADAVRSVNTLHAEILRLHQQVGLLGAERVDSAARDGDLAGEHESMRAEISALTARLEQLRTGVSSTFVNLSLRTLGLVERQLGVIEGLEDREQDPERLATLFKLDHFATVMRRHSENLLVLAGHEHGHQHPGAVPLVDVMRAAVSEIERYERVEIQSLPPHARIAGFAADDTSHLVAELLENATSFSPPDAKVQLSGWLLENGELMLSVQDQGIGMTASRLAELNELLAEPAPADPHDASGPAPDAGSKGLGLYVVTRLAARHGIRVELREQKEGGITAVAVLPKTILPTTPAETENPAETRTGVQGAAPVLNLPGSVAEANSNRLPRREGRSAPETHEDAAVHVHGPYAIGPDAHASAADEPSAAVRPAADQDTGAEGTDTGAADSGEGSVGAGAVLALDTPALDTPAAGPAPDPAPAAEPDPMVSAAEDAIRDAEATGTLRYSTPEAPAAPGLRARRRRGADDDWPGAATPADGGEPAEAPAAGAATPADGGGGLRPRRNRGAEDDWPGDEGAGAGTVAGTGTGAAAELPNEPARAGGHEPGADLGTDPGTDPDAVPAVGAAGSAADAGSTRSTPGAGVPSARRRDDEDDWPGEEHARRGHVDQPTARIRMTDLPAQAAKRAGEAAAPVPEAASAGAGAVTHDGTSENAAGGPRPPAWDRVTDKGLPKRTPRIVAPDGVPARERAQGVDADELRRRLGGFRRGTEKGRREAEAEIAQRTGDDLTGGMPTESGTVEEARS